jgi:lipopolysaccharide/colanic/teichoic acid biosynthesis glycosyltransferase
MINEPHADELLAMIAKVAPEVRLKVALRDKEINCPDYSIDATPFDDATIARILQKAGINPHVERSDACTTQTLPKPSIPQSEIAQFASGRFMIRQISRLRFRSFLYGVLSTVIAVAVAFVVRRNVNDTLSVISHLYTLGCITVSAIVINVLCMLIMTLIKQRNVACSALPSLDALVAIPLLAVTAPITLMAVVLVRLTSRGPALYAQRRTGLHGRVFTIYKIRTMYQDSGLDRGPMWSGPGDPRVTPIGQFLRVTHIDELPQLLNVVLGDMSLIGPRPERPEIVAQLERSIPHYRDRLLIRPGLSGLAQVLQGHDTRLHEVHTKLLYDLYYLNNQGFWLDLRIALATVLYMLGAPGLTIARVFGFPLHSCLFVDGHPKERPKTRAKTQEIEEIATNLQRISTDYVNSAAS